MTITPITRPIPISPDPVFRILPIPFPIPPTPPSNGGIVPPWLRD